MGIALLGAGIVVIANPSSYEQVLVPANDAETGVASETGDPEVDSELQIDSDTPLATDILEKLEVKGRAPKTGYSREEFYTNWPNVNGCSLRQVIIKREFGETAVLDGCNVISGEFREPYTGEDKTFTEKSQISKGIQIDHVVALSDAWQKGAQNLTADERYELATDPLNLLAVDASANQAKSDGDAATWLPKNKSFRCQYVARQITVKFKYHLWVSEPEKEAMQGILEGCPGQKIPEGAL